MVGGRAAPSQNLKSDFFGCRGVPSPLPSASFSGLWQPAHSPKPSLNSLQQSWDACVPTEPLGAATSFKFANPLRRDEEDVDADAERDAEEQVVQEIGLLRRIATTTFLFRTRASRPTTR